MGFLIVFLGGGIGAALRHGVNLAVRALARHQIQLCHVDSRTSAARWSWAAGRLFRVQGRLPQHWRLFLTTGILGGYTTFSAFSLDTILLYERGERAGGALRGASVGLSVGGLFSGSRWCGSYT